MERNKRTEKVTDNTERVGEKMRLNEDTEVIVDRLNIRKNIMTVTMLAKNISGKPEDLELKLAVKFQNATETRILPLPIIDNSFDEHGNCIAYAYMEYELDALFENRNLNEFKVLLQAYDGKTYVNVTLENEDFNKVKAGSEYACLLEDGQIVIRRKKPTRIYKRNLFISLLCSIYRILEFVIGTLLIPLFLLDGVYVVILGNHRGHLEETYGGSQLKRTLLFAKWRWSSFCRIAINRMTLKKMVLNITASFLTLICKKDCILFASVRRNDLTGNIVRAGPGQIYALF